MNEETTTKTEFSYKKLFMSTFIISAFTVGGGIVIVPLLREKFVTEYGWLNDKETLDLVAIAQSMPGVVAVNAAIILGYRARGLTGALTALLATILPPLITLSAIAVAYDAFIGNTYMQMMLRGMQCGATALILNVALDLLQKLFKKKLALPIFITVSTFVASTFFRVNIMWLILLNGIIGITLMRERKYD